MKRDPIHDLRRYASHLESEVSASRAEIRARQAIRAARSTRHPRRTVLAAATAVLMGIGNAALATAADPAIPGDALYGVDRGYERIAATLGIGGSHVGERFDEAGELVALGRASEALELVQETLSSILESDDPQQAVADLIAAGDTDVATQVAALLTAARGVDPGSVDGQAVANAARRLVGQVELPDQAKGNPRGPADPGPPDGAGPPDDPGPPDGRGSDAPGENPGRGNKQP